MPARAPERQPPSGRSIPDVASIRRAARVSPSIRATTSSSKRRPAPARRPCSSARYVNLLKAGVDPANILAITFTRKAAAEMRERIIRELQEAAARSEFDRARWIEMRDRLGDIAISTIDAFCLSLLREFPLEADLDPGFDMADETEVPRLVEDVARSVAADLRRASRSTSRTSRSCSRSSASSRTREGLASLLERRLVAWDALDRFLATGPVGSRPPRSSAAARRPSLQDALRAVPGGLARFLADGPVAHPRYQLLVRDLQRLSPDLRAAPAMRTIRARARPRRGALPDGGRQAAQERRHPPVQGRARLSVAGGGEAAPRAPSSRSRRTSRTWSSRSTRDLNVVLARGIRRMFADRARRSTARRSTIGRCSISPTCCSARSSCCGGWTSSRRAASGSRRAITTCSSTSSRTRAARSGSWCRCSIQSWGEGLGLATQPSIFIVGDRKQSIYRFRDAEVGRAAGGRRASSRRCGPGQPAPVDQPQLPRGARAAGVRQRALRGDVAARGAAGRLHLHRSGSLSRRRCRCRRCTRCAARSGARAGGRRTIPRRARRRWRPRSSGSCARRPSAIGRPASRARPGRRYRDPVSIAHEPSRVRARARAARHSDLRLQRPRLLRRRRDQGRLGADALPRGSRIRPARGGVPALAVRPPVRSRRWRSSARSLAAAITDPQLPPALPVARRRGSARARLHRARARAATGSRRSIACRRPS